MMWRWTYVGAVTILAALLVWEIGVAMRAESLFVAGPRLAADPWGWVTIVDVYLGFVVFGGYLCLREGRVVRALPWLVAIALLGNVATAGYVLWVTWRANGDVRALLRPARG